MQTTSTKTKNSNSTDPPCLPCPALPCFGLKEGHTPKHCIIRDVGTVTTLFSNKFRNHLKLAKYFCDHTFMLGSQRRRRRRFCFFLRLGFTSFVSALALVVVADSVVAVAVAGTTAVAGVGVVVLVLVDAVAMACCRVYFRCCFSLGCSGKELMVVH